MSENKTFLQFACGARIPAIGYLKEPWTPHVRRMYAEDGRPNAKPRLVVYSSLGFDRPTLPDGTKAPCMFGCEIGVRKSGRKTQRCFPNEGTVEEQGRQYMVTCCPQEIEEE